ncbi:MAG: hypothetical protein ACMVO3_07990 [Thalassobaculum sp.]
MTDRVYTIPIGTPFLDRLAAGVWERVGGDPIALTDVRLLLPTRRAVRSAADAFLRFGDGRPMLLPKLSTVSDVDEDLLDIETGEQAGAAGALEIPPAIPDLQRQLELMRLVTAYLRADPDSATPDTPEHAFRLATALARLLDEVQMHGLDFAALNDLAPDAYAAHWDKTIAFLKIVTEVWPGRLDELAAIDPMARRDALMRAEAAALRANPPTAPVIVAGSTGSIPATTELMRTVLKLPAGAIVLPGLDLESDAASWAAIGDDPTHPQHGLHSLLRTLGVERDAVRAWSPAVTGSRDRLIRETMRPAATTEAWRTLSTAEDAPTPAAFDGLRRIDAASPREEAGIIALLMREVLEQPGKTAALITPDRRLARRVAVELRRWRIDDDEGDRLEVNDSGGAPLSNSPVAVFLRLLAKAATDCAPVALLSLLKHPLSACGMDPDRFGRAVERLDREILRGPRPAAGLDGLRKAVEASGLDAEPKGGADRPVRPVDQRPRASGSSTLPAVGGGHGDPGCPSVRRRGTGHLARHPWQPAPLGRRGGRSHGPAVQRVRRRRGGHGADRWWRLAGPVRRPAGRAGGAPALRQPSETAYSRRSGSPPARLRPGDPGRPQRGHLAGGAEAGPMDEPAHAPGFRPARHRSRHRQGGARRRHGAGRSRGVPHPRPKGRRQPDHTVALAPAPRHRRPRPAQRRASGVLAGPGFLAHPARHTGGTRSGPPAGAAAAPRPEAAQTLGNPGRHLAARSVLDLRPLHPRDSVSSIPWIWKWARSSGATPFIRRSKTS